MKNINKILSIFMSALMLFISLPSGAFAFYNEPKSIYEKGQTYSINGVDYRIEENSSVTVTGPSAETVPECLEFLSSLGEFTVRTIGVGAFYNYEAVKKVIIPETVTTISHRAFEYSGLTDIEIKGNNVSISTNFQGTPLYKQSRDNWINAEDFLLNDVFLVSGYAVDSFVAGEIVLGEDIKGIGEKCFKRGCNGLSKLTVLNPDCHIVDKKGNFPSHTVLCGYKGSTIESYAEKYGYMFSFVCGCDDNVFVPESDSLCDGTVGFLEGYWCENCNIYVSGGAVDTSFEHPDADENNICDLCGKDTYSEITNAGKCGEDAVWTVSGDGVLRISGTGNVYSYDTVTREPWYGFRNEIKAFTADDGIESLRGISFENYEKLEEVIMGESVSSIPSSFENCISLKNVIFPKYALSIPSYCFAGCTSLEKVSIPKNIISVGSSAFRKCTRLSDIDFETGYVKLDDGVFYGTAAYNDPDNIKDGFLYIDNCLIKQITEGAETLVLGPEITSIAYGWHYFIDLKVTSVTVYNTDCVFPRHTDAVGYDAVLRGYVGSTAWFYCKDFGVDFEAIEPHTHTEIIDIPAVMPTKTKAGYTHQTVCSVCGDIVSERQRIAPSEYIISSENNTVTAKKTKKATSEENGTDVVITFSVRNDICLSSIKETVIYKVGQVTLSESEFIYNGKIQKPTVTVKDSKGTPLVLNKDYKVTYPEKAKYCGEYSVRVDFIGNYAGSKTLNYRIYIASITPEIGCYDAHSILLSWNAGHADLIYRVYSVDENGKQTKIADTKNDNYEIASLDADTEYCFTVRAYMRDENGNIYWGETGNEIFCITDSESSVSLIKLLKSFIERLMVFLRTVFVFM